MCLTQVLQLFIQHFSEYFSICQFLLAGASHSSNLPVIAMFIMDFGPQIRKIRERKNVTQEFMAGKLGISKTTYGNIERNGVKRLALGRVMEIARVLNVHYSELFGGCACGSGRGRADQPGMKAVMDYLQHLHKKMESMEKQLQHIRCAMPST